MRRRVHSSCVKREAKSNGKAAFFCPAYGYRAVKGNTALENNFIHLYASVSAFVYIFFRLLVGIPQPDHVRRSLEHSSGWKGGIGPVLGGGRRPFGRARSP